MRDTWEALEALYARAATADEIVSVVARMDALERSEQTEAARRARESELAREYVIAREAQYRQAVEECRGELLSRAGKRRGIDELALWRMSERELERYASEELMLFFGTAPRVTPGAFRAGMSAAADRRQHDDSQVWETTEAPPVAPVASVPAAPVATMPRAVADRRTRAADRARARAARAAAITDLRSRLRAAVA